MSEEPRLPVEFLHPRIIRVVIDTNVIISSAISIEGNPSRIFELLLWEEIENYTSEEIIKEIKGVLGRSRISERVSLIEKEFVLNNFERFSKKIKPNLNFNEIPEDPDDNKFLECAVSAGAEFIISGDDHLLKLREFRGIKIVNPADFLKIIESSV